MTKRLLFIFFLLFAAFISFPKNVLADCFCETHTDSFGTNSCVLQAGSGCASGKTATCQVNLDGSCSSGIFNGGSCMCLDSSQTMDTSQLESAQVSCTVDNGYGVNTAFGCVPVEMDKFIAWLLPYLFGLGGAIAFILMIVGFIQMTMSNGDPKAVQGAKETITSAIIGLLICIFAIFLLHLITVNILQIPGIS